MCAQWYLQETQLATGECRGKSDALNVYTARIKLVQNMSSSNVALNVANTQLHDTDTNNDNVPDDNIPVVFQDVSVPSEWLSAGHAIAFGGQVWKETSIAQELTCVGSRICLQQLAHTKSVVAEMSITVDTTLS